MFFVSVARGGKRSNDFVYDSFEWLTDWLTEWMNEWVNDCDGVTNWQSELFKFSGIGGRSVGQGLLLWREMFTRFQVVNWFDFGHFGTFVCLQNFCSRQVAKISIETTNLYVYLPVPRFPISPFPRIFPPSVGVIDGGRGRRGGPFPADNSRSIELCLNCWCVQCVLDFRPFVYVDFLAVAPGRQFVLPALVFARCFDISLAGLWLGLELGHFDIRHVSGSFKHRRSKKAK